MRDLLLSFAALGGKPIETLTPAEARLQPMMADAIDAAYVASLPVKRIRRSTKEWQHMITLAGFRIMSEGIDNSQLAPDAKGCVSEEHVAEWFAHARDQGYAFKEIEEDAALMTGQDGQSRKIWVEAAHNGARVSITRWLTH
jgi:hypothetical protein